MDSEADADDTSEPQVESEVDFDGDSLQTAQDKIMSELTRLQDDELVSLARLLICHANLSSVVAKRLLILSLENRIVTCTETIMSSFNIPSP
jgi:hypothetical protein